MGFTMSPFSTALYEWHSSNGKMTTFANWRMPVKFSITKKEHMAVREEVGLFDISHMSRIFIHGEDSAEFLDYILTRNLRDMPDGKCIYSLACNEEGGTKDDLVANKIKRPKDDPSKKVKNKE